MHAPVQGEENDLVEKIRAVQVSRVQGPLELVKRNLPEPGRTGANQGTGLWHLLKKIIEVNDASENEPRGRS